VGFEPGTVALIANVLTNFAERTVTVSIRALTDGHRRLPCFSTTSQLSSGIQRNYLRVAAGRIFRLGTKSGVGIYVDELLEASELGGVARESWLQSISDGMSFRPEGKVKYDLIEIELWSNAD